MRVLHAFLDGLDGKPAKVQITTCMMATLQVIGRVDPTEGMAQMVELTDLMQRLREAQFGRVQ
jgi:hypothetical protein